MTIPAERIEVGKCYLIRVQTGQRVRRVVGMPNGRVQFEERPANRRRTTWTRGILNGRSFASLVEREVPCDWMPGGEG